MRRGSEGVWAAHKQKREEVRDSEDREVCVRFVELHCEEISASSVSISSLWLFSILNT